MIQYSIDQSFGCCRNSDGEIPLILLKTLINACGELYPARSAMTFMLS